MEVGSKGGNVLLNVSPDERGLISDLSIRTLDEVGGWIFRNGESIYGKAPAPLFPYVTRFGKVGAGRDGSLYLYVERYPEFPHRVSLTGLVTRVKRATLLCDGTELRFAQSYELARDEHRFYVFLPETAPDTPVTVIKLELDGAPEAQTL